MSEFGRLNAIAAASLMASMQSTLPYERHVQRFRDAELDARFGEKQRQRAEAKRQRKNARRAALSPQEPT